MARPLVARNVQVVNPHISRMVREATKRAQARQQQLDDARRAQGR